MSDVKNTRLRALQILLSSAEPLGDARQLSLESIIECGAFSDSAMYPSYWSSANAGAALALELGYKVKFSRKMLLLTFVPVTAEDKKLFDIRVTSAREREEFRRKATKLLITELRNAAKSGNSKDDEDANSTVSELSAE